MIDNVKEEEVEGVVEGEAEAGPGVAAVVVVAHLGAEMVAVEVAGGEDTSCLASILVRYEVPTQFWNIPSITSYC